MLLSTLKFFLESFGYRCECVTDPNIAFQKLQVVKPDLILLDVSMPGMMGYDLCTRLRQNPSLKPVPILFLTTAADRDTVQRAVQAGGNDYLLKPITAEALQKRIERWVKPAV